MKNVIQTSTCEACGRLTINHEKATIGSAQIIYIHPQNNKLIGISYILLGWIFITLSLLFVPIIFGLAAVYMGFKTYYEKSQLHGAILMFFATAGTVAGTFMSLL